jgi:hypothetical protein
MSTIFGSRYKRGSCPERDRDGVLVGDPLQRPAGLARRAAAIGSRLERTFGVRGW